MDDGELQAEEQIASDEGAGLWRRAVSEEPKDLPDCDREQNLSADAEENSGSFDWSGVTIALDCDHAAS